MTLTTRLLKHLDDAAIERALHLCEESATEGDNPSTRLADDALVHLAECSECDQRLRMHRDAHNRLESLRLAQQDATAGICSEAVDWTSVAADLLPEVEVRTHLQHASECAHCGYLLKAAIADLSEVTNPEEDSILASLKSSTPEWQLALANKIGSARVQSPPSNGFKWRFLLKPPSLIFATVLLLLVAGMLVVSRYRRSESPIDLIASAYSEHRTMDLRISGAKYSPKLVERGSTISNVDRPVPLQRAEELIHEGLLKNPNDADLLDAKARADLLDGAPGEAIRSLERALESQPDSKILETDLASAYFMRGDTEHAAIDYGRAMDQLGKVLAASPGDSVALFNRALAEDRLFLYSDEIRDWTKFLQVEKDAGWLSEGKAQFEAVQRKLAEHRNSSRVTQHNPSAILAAIHAKERGSASDGLDVLLDEAYLPEAISQWLPYTVSQDASSGKHPVHHETPEMEAAEALADDLKTEHKDLWLRDLLAGPRSPPWARGVMELALAERADSLGSVADMLSHSVLAISFFKKSGNAAGESAARLIYLNTTTLSLQADRCLNLSDSALGLARLHHYIWIESNLLFQASTCNFMIGRQQAALQLAERATALARQAHYKTLELQGAYFLDGVTTTSISTSDSWDRIRDGLAEFWRLSYPPRSGEGFYSDLSFAAQNEGLWRCAEATSQESLVIHSSHDDQLVIAGAHHRLAKAAEAAGDDAIAEQEYSNASEMLARMGRAVNLDRVELEIERAALEVRLNKFETASSRLHALAAELPAISNHYALIPYHEAAGELHMQTGKLQQAESELLTAISLIEQDKSSLQSQTDLLTWHRDTSQAYRSLLQIYSQSYHDDSKAFALLEWYRAGPTRSPNLREAIGNTDKETPNLRKFLPKNIKLAGHTAVLTWVAFPTSLSIFLLDENGLHSATSAASESALEVTARRFVRLCSDPLSDRAMLDRDAGQLYQWLVEPIADQLKGIRELVIEPDDSFNYIPFALLEAAQGDYLGDHFSVAESPGLGYTQQLRSNSSISSRSVALAVGDPLLRGWDSLRFRPLPEAGKEAANVAAGFRRHFVLIGGDATLPQIEKLLPQTEVFHFAGHAVSQGNEIGLMLSSMPGDPGRAAVLDQKQLRAEDLKNLKLVVLSGCETGIAEQGLLDPENLVRVFLRAGVPNVVATKWQIDSQSSAEMMNQIYPSLIRGTSIREALAFARKIVRSNPRTAHPYYWAAFSVFGG